MSEKRTLAERVKWHAQGDIGIFDARLGVFHVELFKDGGPWWSVRCDPVQEILRFRVAGGVDAAKAEALRIVQKAVLDAAAAWSDQPPTPASRP